MESLAGIPQQSIDALSAHLAAVSGGRVLHTPDFDAYASDVGCFYNRFALRAPYSDAALHALLASAAENGGPGLVGYTEELVGSAWNEALARKGFTLLARQAGMTVRLDEYAPVQPHPAVVRIGADRLQEWSRACERAFGKPSELDALRYWIREDACAFYAYMDADAVAGTLLGYAEDGNYGIHEVCTLADKRGRGICTALVHTALASAKAAGNRYASLQASAMGESVYRSCGLHTDCTLNTWILPRA